MDKKIKLEFQATAVGLEKVFQDIVKITKMPNLNIGDSLAQQLKVLEKDIPGFLQKIQAAVDNNDFSFFDYKELNKEFSSIGKMLGDVVDKIKKSGLGMTLQKQLDEANKELVKRQKELEKSNKIVYGNISKLDSKRESGLGKSEENKVFASQAKKSFGAPALKIDNETIDSYEKFIEVWNRLKTSMDSTSAEYKKLEKFNVTLSNQMTQRATSLKTEANEERATLAAKNAAYQEQVERIQQLNATIQSSNGWTEEEKAIYNELTQILEQLSQARKRQADVSNAASAENKKQQNEAKNTSGAVRQLTAEVNTNTAAQNKNNSTVAKAAKQVFTYGSVMGIFRRVYRTTIQTVVEMDKALTDMAVVTSMNRQEAYQLVGEMQALAQATGQTSTEIANMVTKFLQQGKSLTQAMELTEAAAKAATIAGISGSESIDLLTNAMNGFQISSSHAMEVSDKFAALAASAATDYEELATALSKVAAQANLAGMSMDFTLGMLTKGIEVTREAPETIGTALKTVISRMRELTDYGKTLEDDTDINRVDTALQNVGVSLMDTNGQFRDLEDVLTDLGKKWDTLNVNQQANVAVALAGTRQQSRLIAMMQDFDRTLELVDISANSYGATMAQSADYMEGLGASTTQLTTAVQTLITNLVNSDFIIGVIDKLKEGVQFITDNTWILIGLTGVLGVLALNTLATKTQEFFFNMKQAALLRERAEIETQLQEQNMEHHTEEEMQLKKHELEEQRQLVLKLNQQVLDLKAQKQAKIQLKEQKKQTKEIAKQNILRDQTLSDAQKQAKIQNLENEHQKEIVELEKEEAAINDQLEEATKAQEDEQAKLNQLSIEYGVMLQDQANYNQAIQDAMNAQNAGLGLMGKLLNALLTPLTLIIGLMNVINMLKTVSIKLAKKEQREEIKLAFKKKITAFMDAAKTAFQAGFPVGLVLGAAILAAIGIMLAVNAHKKKKKEAFNSIEATRASLNKLQADLYNLDTARQNVSKLGDEFETLSSKIIKSSEDLERLKEIATQINDEAGRIVVDVNADAETQLNQIRGYEEGLRREREKKVEQIDNTLAAGLVHYQWSQNYLHGGMVSSAIRSEEARENYIKTMQTDPAFINSIRSVGMAKIEQMADVSTATSDAILDMLVDNIGADGVFSEQGINIEAFESIFEQDGGNFNTFVTQLDNAMNGGTLTDYADFYDKLTDKQKELAKASIPIIESIDKLGTHAVRNFDMIGFSSDEINAIWSQLDKNAKILGKDALDFTELVNSMNLGTETLNPEDMTNDQAMAKRREIYQKLVADQQKAMKDAAGVLNMSDQELVNAANNGNEAAQQYLDSRNALEQAKIEQQNAEAALAKEQSEKKPEGDQVAELQKQVDAANQKVAQAQEELDNFSNATKNGIASINEMRSLLGIVSTDKLIEDIEKLSSSMERLSKVSDITSLSLKEQVEILKDYPSLFSAMERGYMTAAEAMSIYGEQLDKTTDTMGYNRESYQMIYDQGTGDIIASENWKNAEYGTDYSQLFSDTELGAQLRKEIASENLQTSSIFVQTLFKVGLEKDPNYTWDQALNAAKSIQADINALNEQELMQQRLHEQGVTALLSESARETWANANSQVAANRAIIESNKEKLEQLEIGSAEYNEVFGEYTNALINGIVDGNKELERIEDKKNEILTKNEKGDLSKYITFINGEPFLTTEGMNLDDDMKDYLAVVIEQLKNLAEEEKEINENRAEDYEELAQAYIDTNAKILEDQISSLEDRKSAYEKYFEEIDAMNEEKEYSQSREDIFQQLSSLAGGSDAASNALRKDLKAQLNELLKEEADARKEAAREELLASMDEQIEELNSQLDEFNDSIKKLVTILAAQADKNSQIEFVQKEDGTSDILIDGKSISGYSEGGLVDYTGPAIVHGSPDKPEAFLSAGDTKNMRTLLNALDYAVNGAMGSFNQTENIETDNSIIIENINIQTQQLNEQQDFRQSGQIFAEEFAKAIRQRGINRNVKK